MRCGAAPHARDQQRAQQRGDEDVAVTHDRGSEHLALQTGQAERRVSRVQRVVGPLQEIGDHERRVHDRHRDDPDAEPDRRGESREQHAEGHAAERREDECGGVARKAAAVRPCENEEGKHDPCQRGA